MSLWPNLSALPLPRGMREILQSMAGDIAAQTNNKIEFYVDTVGVGASGLVQNLRYNCYLRVPANSYAHLLFQVTTPAASSFPATVATAEGDKYENVADESQLRQTIQAVLQRDRTKEILAYLLNLAA